MLKEETVSDLKLTAKIQNITNLGLMTITFSDIIQNVTLSYINSSVFDIYVIPAQDRHLFADFNESEVNLTWTVVNMTQRELQIQIEFLRPVSISPLIT